MEKSKYIIYAIVVIVVLGLVWFFVSDEGLQTTPLPEDTNGNGEVVVPDYEQAEFVGFNFILDFIKIAPPESDPEAIERVYEALSAEAREEIDKENLVRDMAYFVLVQDVPDQGASVEDLQIVSDTVAVLVVGLNYTGSRTMREVELIVEDGEWKVNAINIPEFVSDDDAVVCAMDVMECPDGSFVGRLPPDCDFAPCPGE